MSSVNEKMVEETSFDDLFTKDISPSWWNSNSKVTYVFCQSLFNQSMDYKHALGLSEQLLMEKVLKCLDCSIIFCWDNNNFKNFKRKVMTRKNNLNEIITSLYVENDHWC